MRLIDADALIAETMKNRCADCDRRKGIKQGKTTFVYDFGEAPCRACDVGDMIDTLDEATTVGGWISVKDGLPNDSKPVYVWLGIGSSLRSGIPFVGKYNIFSGEWMIYGLRADNQEIIKITHWMSLPELPEEESNGNCK